MTDHTTPATPANVRPVKPAAATATATASATGTTTATQAGPDPGPSATDAQGATSHNHTGPAPLVIKLGGAAGIDPAPLLRDLAAHDGPWVLIHGGNQELDDISTRLGHPPRFVTSPSGHISRATDPDTMACIQMVYRGRINNDLVLRLQNLGVNAVGLSGVDGGLWRAKRKAAIRIVEDGRTRIHRDDLTGTIEEVDPRLLYLLLGNGFRPVLTLPALAHTGEAVNVDGDRAAAAVAAALGASDLVVLSNVPGLLRDPGDPSSLIDTIPRAALDDFEGFAKGRFRKKLMGVREALAGGVDRVMLADARSEHPLQDALAGRGTVIQ